MRVLLVVDSSTRILGATDVDQKGGSSGSAAKWMAKWLEATGYARMKVQSDAEQSIEHLLKAVKSICTNDLIGQVSSISRSCRKSSTIGSESVQSPAFRRVGKDKGRG